MGSRSSQRSVIWRWRPTLAVLAVAAAAGCRAGAPALDENESAAAPSGSALATSSGAESAPPPPARAADAGAEVEKAMAECLSKYAKPVLTPADVKRIVEEGVSDCFARDRRMLRDQAHYLPRKLGIDRRNGQAIELGYFCSDVCPDAGRILVRYAGIPKASCCKLGGYPKRDLAWGTYIGCAPPEVPLPRFNYRRRPDAPLEQATRSPCDPLKIVFEDGSFITVAPPPATSKPAPCGCPDNDLSCNMRCRARTGAP